MDESPMNNLPQETLHQIFSSLTLREIVACRSVCRSFRQTLTSPSFISLLLSSKPPLSLIALRPPPHLHHRHHHSLLPPPPQPSFPAFDPTGRRWLRFDLSFLPFRSLHPVASAAGLVYLWASDPFPDLTASPPSNSNKSLLACNPLTRQFKVLPQLGSAWSRHGAVLVDYDNRVMVLMEPAALYLPDIAADSWVTFASNLPAKPRSPVLISSSVFALCDVGSPWRSQWKLFTCTLNLNNSVPVHEQLGVGSGSGVFSSCSSNHNNWVCLEKHEWADIFDLIKRPRLVRGDGNKLLMIGGLKSTFSLNPSCSTMLILRLDLEKLEWEEAGRMPLEMYRCFLESSKLKVFGGGDRVCFSAKRLGKIALWDDSGSGKEGEGEGAAWRWIDEVPGGGDGISRGFTYDARLTALP
ncbi:unnamed protein product [Linum trigynum]|uniref:F-box domain-containing protein n=1 Tax=Linum trigynum TaxID=586398 RepID=A0AAV2D1L1_9ROSI